MLVTHLKTPAPATTHEWGFLDWWSFIGTLATMIGLILALIGLYVAVKQIKQTINAVIASADTARNMWQQQLGRRLVDLKETYDQIEKCAYTDNRLEMRRLLNEWLRLASEVHAIIERVIFPGLTAGTDFMSDLGLNRNGKTSVESIAPQFAQFAAILNGSISAARTASSQLEIARRNRTLVNLTRTCREKISEVIVESARFQFELNAQMVLERAHGYGT